MIKFKNKLRFLDFLIIGVIVIFQTACEQDIVDLALENSSENSNTSPLVPFDEYIQNISKVKYEEYTVNNKIITEKAEYEKMTEHILEMYDGVKVSNSHLLTNGQTCDCIPILQQPSLRRKGGKSTLESAPSITPEIRSQEDPSPSTSALENSADKQTTLSRENTANQIESIALSDPLYDKHGNKRACDEGFIPMIRLSLNRMTKFKSLNDFFNKCPNGDCHLVENSEYAKKDIKRRYAYLRNIKNNHGGGSNLNIWKPKTPPGRSSISQQWYASGIGSSTQTVEGGWKVSNNRTPELFIYHTTGGYESGTGCFNLDCKGFVQTDNHWTLGRSFNTYSKDGGNQYDFRMFWYKNGTDGAWWLWLEGYDKGDGRWIGYYPNEIYGTGTMASHATRVSFGGEVSYDNDVSSQSLEMGSGKDAREGWRKAAYQRNVVYFNTSNIAYHFNLGTPTETVSSCYSINKITGSSKWGTYFYFGGDKCN